MDADRIELVRRLFTAMTEKAEELHELAIAGQTRFSSPGKMAKRVGAAARAIEALASAAAALTEAQDFGGVEDSAGHMEDEPDDRASGDPDV